MRTAIAVVTAAFGVALAQPVTAQQGDQPVAPRVTPDSPVYSGRAVTTRGTVESVDRQTRTIVIKDEDARLSSLRVGPDMPNFDKLAKGTKVTVRYAEAMLVSLGNTDTPPKPQVDRRAAPQAPQGNQPAMRDVQHTRVMGEITEIDGKRNRIRLQTAKGEDILMAVPDPKRVAGLNEGDEVVATYIEAFALAIEPGDGTGTAESEGRPAPR